MYASANYSAVEHRDGSIILRHLNSGWSCFFQCGDDAEAFRDEVEGLDRIADEGKRDDIFDAICSEYHACLD